MSKQRKFSTEFKRQVVEEYLSGVSTAAQLCRRHSISSGLLYHWRKQFIKNSFEADSAKEAALEERIGQLEQALGKAHLENEFLKKALHQSFNQSRRFRECPFQSQIQENPNAPELATLGTKAPHVVFI